LVTLLNIKTKKKLNLFVSKHYRRRRMHHRCHIHRHLPQILFEDLPAAKGVRNTKFNRKREKNIKYELTYFEKALNFLNGGLPPFSPVNFKLEQIIIAYI